MNEEEFINELKQTRQQIESCLADKDKEYFVGEFSRKDLEILSRALLIVIQMDDLYLKGR